MPRSATASRSQATRSSASPTRSARSSRSRKDAFALLQEDHKRVQKMFKQFGKMDHEDTEAMQELVTTVCQELEVHAMIEEEIFYPALREAVEENQMEMLEEAWVEHDTAKQLIAALSELQPDDPKYAATFTVLGEYVNHHIEEEESEIFKQARKAKLDTQTLGEEMKARKEELMDGAMGGRDAGARQRELNSEDEEDMERAAPKRRAR